MHSGSNGSENYGIYFGYLSYENLKNVFCHDSRSKINSKIFLKIWLKLNLYIDKIKMETKSICYKKILKI